VILTGLILLVLNRLNRGLGQLFFPRPTLLERRFAKIGRFYVS
jgi:hypothetical protein